MGCNQTTQQPFGESRQQLLAKAATRSLNLSELRASKTPTDPIMAHLGQNTMNKQQRYCQLITLIEKLGFTHEKDLPARIEQAQKLIDGGLNLNPDNGQDSIFTLLCDMDEYNYKNNMAGRKIVRMLLKAGANPLLNNTQEAWAMGDDSVNQIMLGYLVAMEKKGKPLKTHDGGNLLHLMADENPSCLVDLLYAGRVGYKCKSQVNPDWVNEFNQKGQTPLHCLLSSNSTFGRALDSRDDHAIEAYLGDVWATVDTMINMEFNLGLTDAHGESGAQAIVRLHNLGFGPYENVALAERIVAVAKTVIEQQQLRESTPAIARLGRRNRGL